MLPGLTMGLDELRKLQKGRGLWKLRVDRVRRSSTPWHVWGSFTLPLHDLDVWEQWGIISVFFIYPMIMHGNLDIQKEIIFLQHSDYDRSRFCGTTRPLCRSPFAGRWKQHIYHLCGIKTFERYPMVSSNHVV